MKNKDLITMSEPHSMVSECYKLFRTNLSYINPDSDNKVLLFTSTNSEEGKATVLSNSAISFAQSGKKVLLIESDLRRSRIHEIFKLAQGPGLTSILSEKRTSKELIQKPKGVGNLDIITSGLIPAHPSELLASPIFEKLIQEAREHYDIILLNAPPVLGVSDAIIISKIVDGVILIIAKKETQRENIKLAKEALSKVGANILGVLLTQAEFKNLSPYYNFDIDKKKISGKKVSVF